MQDKAANLPECSLVHGWLEQAREAFELSSAHETSGADEAARQLRALTRAQVRSSQILDALATSARKPLQNAM
ncbi:hypothetical protein [Ottowia sp. VDI28]|uniref:hypothetical protein n=1 Tax=Ottowia sp. VDI28 TaxID=3133968 RepID=UPI003C2E01D6